jgi:hypothetical protein
MLLGAKQPPNRLRIWSRLILEPNKICPAGNKNARPAGRRYRAKGNFNMSYLHPQSHSCNQNSPDRRDVSWPAIVGLMFDIVAHRDRLALKRRAIGGHKRRLARRQRNRWR